MDSEFYLKAIQQERKRAAARHALVASVRRPLPTPPDDDPCPDVPAPIIRLALGPFELFLRRAAAS